MAARAARGLIRHCARALAASASLWADDVWIVDSAPVECARSRETVKRSDPAGWAQYGYCASHSRWFWGLRLHLVTTLHGLPVGYALAGAKPDERQVLPDILADDDLPGGAGQVIIGRKCPVPPPTVPQELTPAEYTRAWCQGPGDRVPGPTLAGFMSSSPAGQAPGELRPVKLRVKSARGQQFVMGSAFGDLARVDHQDLVCLPDRR
jgi:hypothetical protein